MVLDRKYSAETRQILNQKGLKCVCELCDCGRYHRHEGCTKNVHKIQQVFKRPGMDHVSTDYQNTYKQHGNVKQRHLMRPLPKLRNPNPPPMDFRTEQRMEFIKREMPMTKPCKMAENYERSDDKLDDVTVYKQEFVPRGVPSIPKVTRPKTVIAPNTTKFQDKTTHNSTFTHKIPAPQVTFGELPSFTGSILFPDPASDTKTTNQEVYSGKFAKVAALCKPLKAQVTIGIEGEYSHGTTHRETFKAPEKEGRQQPRIQNPNLKTDVRAKFQSQTQFKSDFPGFGGKMPKPTRMIPPPPETVNLAMNNNREFKTTNEQFFTPSWDPKTIGRTRILKPDADVYKAPEVKMQTVTQSMSDFIHKEPVKMPNIRPQTRTEASKSKFRDETAYKSQFKHYRTVPFKRYGDLHESGFYLKPVTKFYQDGSVTMQDFQGAYGGKPSTPHRPIQKLHNPEGGILDQTTYNSTYVQKPAQMCSYLEWVKERETKKMADKIAQKQQTSKTFQEMHTVKSAVVCGK